MDPKGEAPFQTMGVLPIFPTYLWKSQLTDEAAARINERILGKLDQMTAAEQPLRPGAMWQTDQTMHELVEFTELMNYVDAAAGAVVDFLKLKREPLVVTGCWANIGGEGTSHKRHTHPNNFLSGVYYAEAPKGADTISFHDPRPQAAVILPTPAKLGAENAGRIHLDVSAGTLLMFPAWLEHSVRASRSTKRRVSVSFNLMFAAFAEKMGQPQWRGNIGDGAADPGESRYRFDV